MSADGTALFVTNNGNNTVGKYNATTGAAINANFITGLSGPNGLALSASGTALFVANNSNGTVGEYNATTGAAINANFITGLPGLIGLALSADGTALFAANTFVPGLPFTVGVHNVVGEYNATTGAAINANLITEAGGEFGPFLSGIALLGNNLFVGLPSPIPSSSTVTKYDATMGVAINANFIARLNGPALFLAVGPTPTPTAKELVWENTVTGEHSIWLLNNGVPGNVISLPTISTQWSIAAAADFLGTGQADLVWENAVTGEHSIWVMRNGVLANVISLPTSPIQWSIADAADSPGTGQANLVWENTVTGEHTIWILNNGVPFSSTKLPTISTEWQIVN